MENFDYLISPYIDKNSIDKNIFQPEDFLYEYNKNTYMPYWWYNTVNITKYISQETKTYIQNLAVQNNGIQVKDLKKIYTFAKNKESMLDYNLETNEIKKIFYDMYQNEQSYNSTYNIKIKKTISFIKNIESIYSLLVDKIFSSFFIILFSYWIFYSFIRETLYSLELPFVAIFILLFVISFVYFMYFLTIDFINKQKYKYVYKNYMYFLKIPGVKNNTLIMDLVYSLFVENKKPSIFIITKLYKKTVKSILNNK